MKGWYYIKINQKESTKILIDDEEMQLLGRQICSQTWLYDNKVLKIFKSGEDHNQTYYTVMEEK